jgi:hypothetical protein
LPSSKTLGFNAITYHRVLSSILSGLVTAQRNGGISCIPLHQSGIYQFLLVVHMRKVCFVVFCEETVRQVNQFLQ